ncbi:PE-PGRS family protein [Mycobacterium tuberculosis T92]|nr:PE-PGRS family protein [Mycobacterium tuberculosis T92]
MHRQATGHASCRPVGQSRRERGPAMEYLIAAQDVLVAAAADLEGIGSALAAANRAAEAPTTGLLAAGADEVSAAIASLFSGNAQAYQALSAQAAAFHQQFVRALSSAAGSYAAAEAAMPPPMQAVLDVSWAHPAVAWAAR